MDKELEELEALAGALYDSEEGLEEQYEGELEDDWEEEDRGGDEDRTNESGDTAGVDDHPKKSGLLVVNQILPDGPANGLLDVGDILLAVRTGGAGAPANEGGGEFIDCTTFVELEGTLDANVGGVVEFMVERGGEFRAVSAPQTAPTTY